IDVNPAWKRCETCAASICSLHWLLGCLVILFEDLGYASIARIHCSIDVVTALQEHHVKKLSNLGGAKNIKLQKFEAAAKHGGRNTSWRGDSIVLCLFHCCPACGLRMDRFQHVVVAPILECWRDKLWNLRHNYEGLLPEAATRAINLWRFFKSRYVNTNRRYLLARQTLDFPRVADCLGNFVDTPFPGS
ncbi:hypothetical protein N7471_004557, partial [Penicillium samsonianum]|uniref:uncharacterized protein n=1 Tax=Penicillium samsonianum TaxID=1882272 RepID=UPI0025480622